MQAKNITISYFSYHLNNLNYKIVVLRVWH